ncbi:MAG: hypothetical protein Q7J29_14750 [Stagnimonas sp.]|nr:hypothetical protein [Stagnimonas sp.]
MLRSLLLVSVIALLSACATQGQNYLDRAQTEIGKRNWDVAYRLVEDGLITTNAANRERAVAMVAQNPQLLTAAEATFSAPRLRASMASYGSKEGARIEGQRVLMYSVVASPAAVRVARANLDRAIADREQLERENSDSMARSKEEEERKSAEARRRFADLQSRMNTAAANARYTCADALQCSKVFALTQIYITEKATMRIQTANDTILETFNPVKFADTGMRAIKVPRAGTSAEVRLEVSCGPIRSEADTTTCYLRAIPIFEGFRPFVQATLQP